MVLRATGDPEGLLLSVGEHDTVICTADSTRACWGSFIAQSTQLGFPSHKLHSGTLGCIPKNGGGSLSLVTCVLWWQCITAAHAQVKELSWCPRNRNEPDSQSITVHAFCQPKHGSKLAVSPRNTPSLHVAARPVASTGQTCSTSPGQLRRSPFGSDCPHQLELGP